MINFDDKIYNAAKRRGYITDETPNNYKDWQVTLVGCWVIKYNNDLKTLNLLAQALGHAKEEFYQPTWADLTERTLKNFRDVVTENMSSNSARTTFAKIKSILNDMKNEVELPTLRYDEILKAKRDVVQNVYLTEKELESLYNLHVLSEHEQYVKSIFLVCCYTGARHSDALLFANENIQDNTLSYVSQKTHIEASVPVHRNLKQTLESYDKSVEMPDYEFNDILRDMCKRAGINTRVKVRHASKDLVGEKWQYCSSHTARRSFVTNLYLRGVDLETIAKLSGHSDSSMTRRYLCCTRGLNSKAMAFFN